MEYTASDRDLSAHQERQQQVAGGAEFSVLEGQGLELICDGPDSAVECVLGGRGAARLRQGARTRIDSPAGQDQAP